MPFGRLEDFKCAPITAENGDLITYGEIFEPSELAEGDVAFDSRESQDFYANNRIIESVTPNALTGTLTVNLGRFNSKLIAKLLGHTAAGNDDGYSAYGHANAPAFGVGVIPSGWYNKKLVYYPRFFPKTTFSMPSESFATMAESVDFKVTTLVGKFVTTSGPKPKLWDYDEFSAEDESQDAADRALARARNWVNGRLGQLVQVQFNLNGAQADDVGGQPDNQNLNAGRAVPVGNLPQLNRQGFRFLGWALTQAGVAIAERFIPGLDAAGALINGAQTLYAMWEEQHE